MGERCNAQRAHRSCDDDLQSDQTRFFPATLGIKIIVTAQPVPAAETGDVDLQNLTGDGTAPPRYVAINILDNGPGMDNDTLARATNSAGPSHP
jgi:hypothetical protein